MHWKTPLGGVRANELAIANEEHFLFGWLIPRLGKKWICQLGYEHEETPFLSEIPYCKYHEEVYLLALSNFSV